LGVIAIFVVGSFLLPHPVYIGREEGDIEGEKRGSSWALEWEKGKDRTRQKKSQKGYL